MATTIFKKQMKFAFNLRRLHCNAHSTSQTDCTNNYAHVALMLKHFKLHKSSAKKREKPSLDNIRPLLLFGRYGMLLLHLNGWSFCSL